MRKLNYLLSNIYVAVFLGVAAIALILKELQFVFGDAPPLLVFLVVIVFASWFGGLRAGFYATALSAAASAVLVEPYHSIYSASSRELLRILLLVVIGTISSLMVARLSMKEKQALNTVMEREKQLRQEIDRRVRASEEGNLYATLAHSSTEFIGMCDPQGVPFYINKAGLQLVGLDSLDQGLKTPVREFFFPEDQAFVMDKFFPEVAKKGQGELEIRFRHFKTGEALWMIYNVFALKDLHGNIAGYGTVSPDITLRKQAEEDLLRLNMELEQRVRARTAELQRNEEQLKASLNEKEVLLKEIHHRVKNNLQIIASLLKMQSDSQSETHVRELFRESQSRIRSMALIHEQLYKTKDLKTIDFADYVAQLINHIHRSFARAVSYVTVRLDIPPFILDIDHALPLGLIVNELVSNSFKYAFANPDGDERKEIWVTMAPNAPDGLTLEVGDSGCGLPDELDVGRSPSMGLQLVRSLVVQLHGQLTVERRPGARFRILIPTEKVFLAKVEEFEQSKGR